MSELPPNQSDESYDQLIEQLLERYDEASALGLPVVLPKVDGLSAERAGELESLARRIDLVNQAARQQALAAGGFITATEPAAPADPFAGEMIGRFRVLRELGRGGYGIVFLAFDSGIGRLVAVKLPRPEVLVTPELVARFLREAQAAGRIDHPHVLPVHEAAEDGGMCYLVTPFCRGLSLAEWFAEHGPVPAHDVAQLGASLAEALACAHEAGVLHRDIKPSNILLDLSATEVTANRELLKQRRLATFVPKLTDFGLAKLLQSSELETRTGTLVGTPTYMAPEQATGRYSDVRTDVYSLGVVMYELLTNQLPADASSVVGLAVPGMQGRIVPPRKLRPSIPRDLEAVVLKCLEPAPVDRYPSAAALADDLHRYLTGKATTARPAGLLRKAWKAARRRPALAAMLLLLIAAVGGLIAGDRWYAWRLDRTQAVLQSREYASDMRQAAIARRQGSVNEARRLLARYETGSPGAELRHFEWYWLQHSINPLHTINSQHGEAYAAKFSPDGKTLYTGGKDGVIRVWNVASGGFSHELHGHDLASKDADFCVNQLDFSPDGKTLASVSCDGTVRLWDVASRQQTRQLLAAGMQLTSLAFAHRHPWLAVDTHQGMIQVWDIEAGAKIAELGQPRDHKHIDALAFRPDDAMLAATTGTDAATLWDTSTWELLKRQDRYAVALAFAGEGSELVLGARDSFAELVSWKVNTEQQPATVGKLPTNVQCLVGMRSDDIVFAGGGNGALRAFRLSNNIQFGLPTSQSRLQSLTLTRDDRYLASASYDGAVRIWDLELNRWPVHVDSGAPVKDAIISPDTRWLAISNTKNELFLWDCQARKQVARFDSFQPQGFSPSGRMLLGSESDGELTALEIPSLRRLDQLKFASRVVAASVSADDRVVALLNPDGVIHVTDMREGKVIWNAHTEFDTGSQSLISLNEDGSLLVVIGKGQLPEHAIETRNGTPAPLPEDLSFLAAGIVLPGDRAVSPDGEWMLHLRDDLGECFFSHLRTQEIRGHLSSRDFIGSSRTWSPDGQRLFVSTRYGELDVIDVTTGTQLCELDTALGRMASPIVCSPDGQRVVAYTTDEQGKQGYLHIWPAAHEK